MKTLRWFLSIALLASAQAQTPEPSSDLTIHLFSTRTLDAITLTPLPGATIKRCNTCASTPLTAAVHVAQTTHTLTLDNTPTTSIEISGELRIDDAQNNRLAIAAGRWVLDSPHHDLRVRLTLPRERYVAAVLAAESAPDDPPAALRALAIVARTFGYARHHTGDFTLCDSTHCQAMRLTPVPARIADAVLVTAGETLWSNNTRITAYFTQHCGGTTEDAAAIWGGPRHTWLSSHPDPYCQRTPSQWHASISAANLHDALAREGFSLPNNITTARILSRTSSGRAARIEISDGAQHITLSATTFRFAINRTLGWNTLRSDWYTLTFAANTATFDGRGYGHGVGLCQAGARALAIEAANAPDTTQRILRFYFPGAQTRITAADDGWQQRDANGWSLLSTTPTNDTIHRGDTAWQQALKLFPTPSPPHPTVRLLPTTDLFRQTSNAPGWTLGATRGDTVFLQPTSIVTAHETLDHLLLHEFLHVLIEHEAQPTTPLWLREGLVEALTANQPPIKSCHPDTERREGEGPASKGCSTLPPSTIDAALTRATTRAQAEAAHHAAAALVAQLLDRYGLATIRNWLRTGVPASILPR